MEDLSLSDCGKEVSLDWDNPILSRAACAQDAKRSKGALATRTEAGSQFGVNIMRLAVYAFSISSFNRIKPVRLTGICAPPARIARRVSRV